MSTPPSLNLKQSQNIRQLQHLIMSRQMQQAIQILQLPVMELTQAIEKELEQNPVLEYIQDYDGEELEEGEEEEKPPEVKSEIALNFSDRDFERIIEEDENFSTSLYESSFFNQDQEKIKTFLENAITIKQSLNEYLLQQAREAFSSPKEYAMAEQLIGNLDENGFLSTPLSEIAGLYHFDLPTLEGVVKTIQTFDPIGIAAKNLKECLLIQLIHKGKHDSLAYRIVDQYFDDLLHNRIPVIVKNLKCSHEAIGKVIDQDIAKLELHPAGLYTHQIVQQIVPDLNIKQEGEKITAELNTESFPPLRLNDHYVKMLHDETLNDETKEFIKQKILSAKWFMRNILQRNTTIERIADCLIEKQCDFFSSPEGNLQPLTMKTIANELALHESTIARAVANKYLSCSRGLFPLRSFFTHAIDTEKGEEIASSSIHEMIKVIINQEDKSHPLSDEAISHLIKNRGIPCARRTVAKYRSLLRIGNTQQRKKYS